MTTTDDIKLQFEPLKFTQAEGLQKTYAHYLLFKEDSPTLLKVLDILVPNKIELFKAIFTELNKKHVSAGLKQFAPNFALAKINWNESKYGITYEQYTEMRKYAELLSVKNPLGSNKMEKEMYENKPQIDFIHEAVIQYFPEDTVEIVKNARKNLQISLKEGYIGKRNSYIPELDTPLAKIDDLKTKIEDDKTKDIFDKQPNVLHLEAVAELHRRAFLSVDQKDALEVIAHAANNKIEDVSGYIPNAKALYVNKKESNQYMVSSIQMGKEFEKYIKIGDCWKKEQVTKAKQGGKQKSKKARSK